MFAVFRETGAGAISNVQIHVMMEERSIEWRVRSKQVKETFLEDDYDFNPILKVYPCCWQQHAGILTRSNNTVILTISKKKSPTVFALD